MAAKSCGAGRPSSVPVTVQVVFTFLSSHLRGPYKSEALGGCLVCPCLRPALLLDTHLNMRTLPVSATSKLPSGVSSRPFGNAITLGRSSLMTPVDGTNEMSLKERKGTCGRDLVTRIFLHFVVIFF